ncbi:MAG: SPOR domain-containing protein [Trichlorobacter sp.]
MRIDYSEPRQSYTIPGPSRQRPSSPSSSSTVVVLAVVGGLLFCLGFGVGWYLSQQSAKKAFRAAMEQQSLETSPKGAVNQQHPGEPTFGTPQGPAGMPPTQPQPGAAQQPQAGTAPDTGPDGQPLSFFENLPKGQKNTVLGSGINEKPKPMPPPVTPVAPQPATPQATTAKKIIVPPAPPKAAAPTGGYLVQVAAYSNRKDADALKAKLSAKGYSVSISETSLTDTGTWYRVRIGHHLDKEAAIKITNQLMMGAKVIPDQD